MPDGGRGLARLLAPLALALVALALVAIVLGSGSGDGESSKAGAGSTETESQRTETSQAQRTTTQPKPAGSTYTVKVNDTLGGIAEETGVSVETLLELNPDLDPQALVSGQKIKLRE
jgi:LysM repeat protein